MRVCAGWSSSHSLTLHSNLRPRDLPDPAVGMVSTIQYSGGMQAACHCKAVCRSGLSRTGSPHPPEPVLRGNAGMPARDPHAAAVAGLGKHITDQRPAEAFRPLAQLFTFSGLHTSGNNHAFFCRQKNQSSTLITDVQRVCCNQGLSLCHQLPSCACHSLPVCPSSSYSGSANGQLICAAPCCRRFMMSSREETSQDAGYQNRTRQCQCGKRMRRKIPGWRIAGLHRSQSVPAGGRRSEKRGVRRSARPQSVPDKDLPPPYRR